MVKTAPGAEAGGGGGGWGVVDVPIIAYTGRR